MPNRRLYTGTEVQTLDARWVSHDGTATIYRSSDPPLNEGTLTLFNSTGGTVTIPQGRLAAYGSVPQGQGMLYLYFNGLLSNEQVQSVTLDAEGWLAAAFTDDVTGLAYLALAPAAAVTLDAGDTLSLPLAGVTASGPAGAGYLTLVMEGATGAPEGSGTQSIFVNVAAAPVEGNQKLELLVEFAGQDFVFTHGQENELLLVLTNPASEPLVPGGAAAWGGEPPTFTFSFVFADGNSSPGALTDGSNANAISVELAGEYGNVWQPVSRESDGEYPVWTVQPDPNGGGSVLGVGVSASVSFRISGLVTYQPAGATYLYLSYANVPGYDDGYFAVEIVKVDPVVASLSANPSSIADATAQTTVQLSWTVQNATYATITNTAMARPVARNGSGTMVVNVATTTVFTLLASNHFTGQTVAASSTVTVTPDVFGMVPRGTIVMWSGAANAVPNGWHLCDGNNGTPNLVNRFVLGAGTANPVVNTTGGSDEHGHAASAVVTISGAGNHRHGVPANWYSNDAGSGGSVTVVDRDKSSVSDAVTQSGGHHTHSAVATVTVDTTYAMPPWYALAFIMKTA